MKLKQEGSVKLIYEKIENIHLDSDVILLQDLQARTGISIKRYEINRIDLLRDVAEITLYFNVNGQNQEK